jgi:hypothetical protein
MVNFGSESQKMVEEMLSSFREVLQRLLAAAIQSEDMATFVAPLTKELPEVEK